MLVVVVETFTEGKTGHVTPAADLLSVCDVLLDFFDAAGPPQQFYQLRECVEIIRGFLKQLDVGLDCGFGFVLHQE